MTTQHTKPAGGTQQTAAKDAAASPGWLDVVREQVASLRFGTVLITVHESRVVQVERHEKLRIDQPPTT